VPVAFVAVQQFGVVSLPSFGVVGEITVKMLGPGAWGY